MCSFETLIEEYHLGGDSALALMARVVHGADVSEDADMTPESRGLEAIARGFMHLGLDDQRQLELELPVYDASTLGPTSRSRPTDRWSKPQRRDRPAASFALVGHEAARDQVFPDDSKRAT